MHPDAPYTYEHLDQQILRTALEREGRVAVRLSAKRATLLRVFLRTDARMRGAAGAAGAPPSGWQVMADFSTAAYLTARIYLFHRKLYDVLALVAVHEPDVEWWRNADGSLTARFTQPAGPSSNVDDTGARRP